MNPLENQKTQTILVVDDMQLCREAVADVLRAHGYDTVSAASGEDALARLRLHPVNLILLDVLMPGMDGLSVLKIVRSNPSWRHLPVILLTDVAQEEKVRAAASLGVNGYLLKARFKTAELLARVSKLLNEPVPNSGGNADIAHPPHSPSMNGTAAPREQTAERKPYRRRDKEEVLNRIRRSLELKPVPPVLHHVVAQTNNSQTSIHEIVNTVRQDQALALRVMKVANSSFYATGKPAQHLLDAAGRLGMSGIRNAVVTVVTMDHFASSTVGGLIPQRFWEHALGTAAIARALAEEKRMPEAEELFLAGLLHDLGRLILSNNYPRDYRAVLEAAAATDANLESVERDAFGLSHNEVAKEALQQLKLPEAVVHAASEHDLSPRQHRSGAGGGTGPLIVGLANRLAHALLLGDSGSPVLYPIEDFLHALSLDAELAALLGRSTAEKLSDTEMFYACQGDDKFLEPLAKELSKSACEAPRVAVFAAEAPNDPFSLFFEQLGLLNRDDAAVAVVYAASTDGLDDPVRQLKAWETRTGRTVGLLLATADGKNPPEREPWVERSVDALRLPLRYSALIEAVKRVGRASCVSSS